MGETTAISWTDHTFNPWWGCERVSPTWDDLWTPQRATTFPKLDRSTLPEDRRTAFDEPRKVCPYVYTHVYNHHRLPTRTEALKYLAEVVASRAKGRAS